MKITRTPLALLALAAFTTAFAGDAGTLSTRQATACQEASCTMDMAKVVHKATVPTATGSWYLPTWEEANAATKGATACDETGGTVAPAAAATTTTWYLPTWEEGAGTVTVSMACCETPCPMEQASHAKPAPAEKPVDSWYLPS